MENALPIDSSVSTLASGHVRETALESTHIVNGNNFLWQPVVNSDHMEQRPLVKRPSENTFGDMGIKLFVMPWGTSRLARKELHQSSVALSQDALVTEA